MPFQRLYLTHPVLLITVYCILLNSDDLAALFDDIPKMWFQCVNMQ